MQRMLDGPFFSVHRKHRRYELQYPVRLQFPATAAGSSLDTLSRNVSLGGMLLESRLPVPLDVPVLLTMTLGGEPIVRPLQITSEGRVVRVHKSKSGFAIAVQCTHPLSRIESLLAVSELPS